MFEEYHQELYHAEKFAKAVAELRLCLVDPSRVKWNTTLLKYEDTQIHQ